MPCIRRQRKNHRPAYEHPREEATKELSKIRAGLADAPKTWCNTCPITQAGEMVNTLASPNSKMEWLKLGAGVR